MVKEKLSWLEQKDIFISGQEGYHTYRIPAVTVTTRGTILAFCEGRKNSARDYGHIDVVLKRSFDNGDTWQNMQVIATEGTNTIGNPCPVVDRETGTIWLLLCRNLEHGGEEKIMKGEAPRDVYVVHSKDDGATWSEPVDITKDVKLPTWTWYATGPCHGIQLKSGRLLVPCNHAVLDTDTGHSRIYISHTIFSDDHGSTWKLGGSVGEKTNECCAAELPDGRVYMNMRSYHGMNRRAYAFSDDGGITWSDIKLDETLIEPVCQGSVISTTDAGAYRENFTLFSNPASLKRERMTVRVSYDGCITWPISKVIYRGPSAYSDLAILPDGNVCCMYENGMENPYEKITFARFNNEWLVEEK